MVCDHSRSISPCFSRKISSPCVPLLPPLFSSFFLRLPPLHAENHVFIGKCMHFVCVCVAWLYREPWVEVQRSRGVLLRDRGCRAVVAELCFLHCSGVGTVQETCNFDVGQSALWSFDL